MGYVYLFGLILSFPLAIYPGMELLDHMVVLFLFVCFFFWSFFAFSRAALRAYGRSQARGLIGAVAAKPTPEPQ